MNPKRKALEHELTKRMVERYGFLKYPVTFEDYNPPEGGVVYGKGEFGGVSVDEVRLFNNGFLISTGESTDYAESVFTDLMALANEAGAEYRPDLLVSVTYSSGLVVRSSVDLNRALLPGIGALLANTFPGQATGFATMSFFAGDKLDLDAVRIERLADQPPASNEYWSHAVLKTTQHLQFLQDFERLFA